MNSQEAGRICIGCGATNASEARFCGLCGRELLDESPDAISSPGPGYVDDGGWQEETPLDPPLASEGSDSAQDSLLGQAQGAIPAPAEEAQQKRCAWCGRLNPWVAAVCENCGARFPVPGQDEAFQRAAEERIRQDEENLQFWRQRRKSWRRFVL